MTPVFLGTIKEGKLFFDKTEQFKQYLHTFPTGKRIEVTVEKLTHPRTNSQNRYYWGVVVKEIAQHTGHDPEQIHELLKQMFSPRWHFAVKYEEGHMGMTDTSIPTSTTRLDTQVFVDYTEKCRVWANEFLGLQIPLPGEVTV
jgi:hypothetical protein